MPETTGGVVWIDASSGASGDMLLGALAGAGVPVGPMAAAVDKVAPGQVVLEDVHRNACAHQGTEQHVAAGPRRCVDPDRHVGSLDVG